MIVGIKYKHLLLLYNYFDLNQLKACQKAVLGIGGLGLLRLVLRNKGSSVLLTTALAFLYRIFGMMP